MAFGLIFFLKFCFFLGMILRKTSYTGTVEFSAFEKSALTGN